MEYSAYTFQHHRAGQAEWDGIKLAIRWSEPKPKETRLELLKKHELKLIEPAESEKSLRVNNTDVLWWVESATSEPIPKKVLDQLESSEFVKWIAPVYRGKGSAEGLESLFTINPTQVHIDSSVAQALHKQLEEMGLEIGIKDKRSTRHTKRVVMVIHNASLSQNRGVIQVARKMLDSLKKQEGIDYERGIRFESIPLISPTCVEFIPNDPKFDEEWGMWAVNAPHAWHITRGSPSVVVAVIDQGVELDHPDLNVHPKSWNATNDDPDGSPVGNHGTACAGIVAARINNTIGVAGMAGNCRVMAIATSTWADADIEEGIYFAADNGAHVISMSFGVYESWGVWDFEIIMDALEYAHELGLVLVAASGNENIPESRFPGSDPRTICVGGSSYSDARKAKDTDEESWWGACYGKDLDIVAPCLKIPTTDRLGAAGYGPDDYYMEFNGTSSATPLVAGLAALILSLRRSLSNDTVRKIIEITCDKVRTDLYSYSYVTHKPHGTWHKEVGYGRINAERAIELAIQIGDEQTKVDMLKEIQWKRHKHTTAVIRAERESLVPLLRQTGLGRVNVGRSPWEVAFDGSHIWVSNLGSNDVSKIEIATNTLVASVEVEMAPTGLVFDGTHIWVANLLSGTLSKIDVDTNAVVATINVEESPIGLVFDGTHIWVANSRSSTLSKIDIATNTVVATIGLAKHAIAPNQLAFDGTHIWVTHDNDVDCHPNVTKVNSTTNIIEGSMKAGIQPMGIVFDGAHMWVADASGGSTIRIDAATSTIKGTTQLGVLPARVLFDGTHIWGGNVVSNSLSKIDVNTGSVIKTVGLGPLPLGMAFDGIHIWVANLSWNSYQGHVTKIPALPLGIEPAQRELDQTP